MNLMNPLPKERQIPQRQVRSVVVGACIRRLSICTRLNGMNPQGLRALGVFPPWREQQAWVASTSSYSVR